MGRTDSYSAPDRQLMSQSDVPLGYIKGRLLQKTEVSGSIITGLYNTLRLNYNRSAIELLSVSSRDKVWSVNVSVGFTNE